MSKMERKESFQNLIEDSMFNFFLQFPKNSPPQNQNIFNQQRENNSDDSEDELIIPSSQGTNK